MNKLRADKWLTDEGYVSSRSKAQELIQRGHITLYFLADRKIRLTKSSEAWPEAWGEPIKVEIKESPLTQYVSRGGWKLAAALDRVQFETLNLSFVDVGQSTGGFSDVLLQRGGRRVVGIDVGHGQIHAHIAASPRVVVLEGMHILQVQAKDILKHNDGELFEGWVSDVSFISIEKVLPVARQLLKPGGRGLALIKPQFELGPSALNKKGLVKDPLAAREVRDKVLRICEHLGYKVLNYFDSEIEGGDGNQEFFLHFEFPDDGSDAQRVFSVSTATQIGNS